MARPAEQAAEACFENTSTCSFETADAMAQASSASRPLRAGPSLDMRKKVPLWGRGLPACHMLEKATATVLSLTSAPPRGLPQEGMAPGTTSEVGPRPTVATVMKARTDRHQVDGDTHQSKRP